MQPIFLIGYMGCGKSTLGRAVSALTGMRFIDLDSYIESRYGMAITEIFSAYGEDGFSASMKCLWRFPRLAMCLLHVAAVPRVLATISAL